MLHCSRHSTGGATRPHPSATTPPGLSARAVSAILHTHLHAAGRPATTRTQWTQGALQRTARPAEPTTVSITAVELEDTYSHSIDARRQAEMTLQDLDDIYDTLDDQVSALLARTEQLFEQINEH